MEGNKLPRPPLELFELATGYQRAKILFALVEFGLPTFLARRAVPLAVIARELGVHPIAADRFLNAGVALGLLERVDGEYRNTALAERFLVKGKPAYLGDQFIKYDRASYPLWGNLPGKLRTWRPGATDDQTPHPDDQGQESLRAQHNLALLVGHALGEAYDFSRHRVLLDLGGGTGAMSIGVCGVHENLRAVVFDLPVIAGVAAEYAREAGLAERIQIHPGNFKEGQLPDVFDVALLANLLSVASEETNRALLARIYERLPAGGACLLSGWILDDTRTGPLIPVLFCLEDINWEAPDVERSVSTYKGWLEEAGFVEIEHLPYCPPTSMIIARKEG